MCFVLSNLVCLNHASAGRIQRFTHSGSTYSGKTIIIADKYKIRLCDL